jgi:hypothetical protein
MYADWRSGKFIKGVHSFLNVAGENKWNGFMCCPCGVCRNEKDYWRGVNSTNVLDEGLRIGEIGRQMNSMVNSVKQGGYESKRRWKTWLTFNLAYTVPSWLLYIGGQVSRVG